METRFLLLSKKRYRIKLDLPTPWPFWRKQIDRVAYILEESRRLSQVHGVDSLKYVHTGQWYEIGLPRFSSIFSLLRAKGYVIWSERIYKDGKPTQSWRSYLVWKPGDPFSRPFEQLSLEGVGQ